MLIRAFPPTLVLFAIAGCSSGPVGNSTSSFDKGFRDSFRPKFVASCAQGAQAKSGTQKDFTAQCGCLADKLMATHTAAELVSGPSDAEIEKLSDECAREHPMT